jgi:hypothetical protein
MANRKRVSVASNPVNPTAASARTRAVAARGVKTSSDFKAFMSGLMSDLVENKLTPQVGNAACNAGGKLLKVVEMEHKYGRPKRSSEAGLVLSR